MSDSDGRPDEAERRRRWRLALGSDEEGGNEGLSARDRRLDAALGQLYGREPTGGKRQAGGRQGSLAGSAPRVARWLDDVREFFPTPVVQILQRDAFERLGLKQMLLQPEMLKALEADVHLVADLIALRRVMPEKAKDAAREVVTKVVRELMERLEARTVEMVRGALNRGQRTYRPRHADIDWPRTIRMNLRHYQPEHGTIVPEKLVGFGRRTRRANLDQVILCVDQSGSMATSVVYASIFAAVLASIPALATKLVVFDTAVLDLTEDLEDPVDVLFGVQLGGGTDINQALSYCQGLVQSPAQTTMVLVSDLYEGGNAAEMLERAAALVLSGVRLIVLLALSDDGRPSYSVEHARRFAALGCPVFACTPDLFPELMAAALRRQDLAAWAAERDIALERGTGTEG